MPERIQMSRQHAWRADHPDAVIVDRSTIWGNPIPVAAPLSREDVVRLYRDLVIDRVAEVTLEPGTKHATTLRWDADKLERGLKFLAVPTVEMIRAELAGKDLACWCGLDQACHADVHLEIANATPRLDMPWLMPSHPLAPKPLCPECRDGKPNNCIGWTLDADDNEVTCAAQNGAS